MNYEEFKNVLIKELKRVMGEDIVDVNQEVVTGKQDVKMDSLAIKFKGSHIEPRFYFSQLYTLYERAYPVCWIANNVAMEGKTYYIKVRGINGSVKGKWSKVKKVKVK